jgi:hypothetical protein
MIAFGCGCETYKEFLNKIGYPGARALGLDTMSGSRLFKTCIQSWKKIKFKRRVEIEDMEVKARMNWVMDSVGYSLHTLIVECWKYMAPKKLLPKGFKIPAKYMVEEAVGEDNTTSFKMNVAGSVSIMNAMTYHGDVTQTAGTWSPNNYVLTAIRLFLLSLAYGLNKHPGDDDATTEDEVRAILHNFPSLTSCESFWVVIFCRQADVDMVRRVMNESTKIRGEADDCVSDLFLLLLRMFDISVRIPTEIYFDFPVLEFLFMDLIYYLVLVQTGEDFHQSGLQLKPGVRSLRTVRQETGR